MFQTKTVPLKRLTWEESQILFRVKISENQTLNTFAFVAISYLDNAFNNSRLVKHFFYFYKDEFLPRKNCAKNISRRNFKFILNKKSWFFSKF